MHSYAREISCGQEEHNLITVVKKEYHLELQDALDWLGEYTDGVVEKFTSDRASLPRWTPEIEKKMDRYIDGLGHWAKGNEAWSFESKRYHGNDGLRVKELGAVWITLRDTNYVGREEVEFSIMSAQAKEGILPELSRIVVHTIAHNISHIMTSPLWSLVKGSFLYSL